jgi:ribosomal protein L11 methyltransferase
MWFGYFGHWGGQVRCHQIDAVDIDDAAVTSTELNARPTMCACKPACRTKRKATYQTVLANILATPLKVLGAIAVRPCAPAGGSLVLAGILERQADELKAAYAPWVAT